MNKRGQFYLVGAIVIVSLIIGFVTITNYTKQDQSTKIYDLSQELGVEGNQVLEYGLVNQGTQIAGSNVKSLDELIPDFTNKYSKYLSDDKVKLVFIFGDKDGLKLLRYNELSGGFSVGGVKEQILGGTSIQNITPIAGETKITVMIDNIPHVFDLQEGQNFYYVVSQENADGSVSVATSKD